MERVESKELTDASNETCEDFDFSKQRGKSDTLSDKKLALYRFLLEHREKCKCMV